jgi:hypothetical protein
VDGGSGDPFHLARGCGPLFGCPSRWRRQPGIGCLLCAVPIHAGSNPLD